MHVYMYMFATNGDRVYCTSHVITQIKKNKKLYGRLGPLRALCKRFFFIITCIVCVFSQETMS